MNKQVVLLSLFLASLVCSCGLAQNSRKLLAIGDSNGAFDYGWVAQLQRMVPKDLILNVSIPGNTIGFDNLGRTELNTLRNLEYYLRQAQDSLKNLDYVLIMLGTNDSKYVFRNNGKEVVENMSALISGIRSFFSVTEKVPQIIIIAPPPFGDDEILEDKYKGGNKRVRKLAREYKKIARRTDCGFVNMYHEFNGTFMQFSKDGIHLNEEGQKIIATKIVLTIDNPDKN